MRIDEKTDGVSFWLKPVLSLQPFPLLLSGNRREVAFIYLTKEEWEISRIDMFPRTDKVHKMPEKPIDIFPRTDEGIGIHAINSCHVECVVLMSRVEK